MGHDTALVRQWLIIKMLSARRQGATVRELAKELGVSEKTIRRDLQTFGQVGFPLEEEVGAHGRKSWRLAGPQRGLDIRFAIDEALALYLGRRFLEPLAGTLLWDAAQRAFRKVRSSLSSGALGYLEKMAERLYQTTIGTGDYAQKAEIVDRLMMAIEDGCTVRMHYRSLQSTEPVEHEIDPYGLVYHRGSLYLVAFSHNHDGIRHFKIDRMEDAEPTETRFRLPKNFRLEEHMSRSFGVYQGDGELQIRVRFSPRVARYVEEGRWHESQKLKRQRDQSVMAEFRLSDTEEIKRWLLSFGRYAEVLEPESFRKEMHDELAHMIGQYASLPHEAETNDATETQRGLGE